MGAPTVLARRSLVQWVHLQSGLLHPRSLRHGKDAAVEQLQYTPEADSVMAAADGTFSRFQDHFQSITDLNLISDSRWWKCWVFCWWWWAPLKVSS